MHGRCWRCQKDVDIQRAWPGFVWLKRGWYAGMFGVLVLMPIIGSEITVLLPGAMVFTIAGGPLLFLSGQQDTCLECGAETAHPPV